MKTQRFIRRALAFLLGLALCLPAAAATGEQLTPANVSALYTAPDGSVQSYPAVLLTDSQGTTDVYWIQVPDASMLSTLNLQVEAYGPDGMPLALMFQPDILASSLDLSQSVAAPLLISGTTDAYSVRFYVVASAPDVAMPDPINPEAIDGYIYGAGLQPSRETAPVPETPVPETPVPETPVPETPVPETPVPETPVPETPVPETPVPETPVPETPVPETPVPETPVPETPVPETPVPETPVPETPAFDPAIAIGHYVAAAGAEGPAMLMQEPGLVDDRVSYVDAGEPLFVNTFFLSDDGVYWFFVTRFTTGEEGFVRMRDVSYVAPEDEEALLAPYLPASTPVPETPVPETPVPETPVPETPVPETPVPETPVPETPIP